MKISAEKSRLNPSPGGVVKYKSTDIFGLGRAPLAM